jgi:hypothetical protein
MSTSLNASLKSGLVAAALLLASSPGMAFDSLRTSFDRILADEPASVQAAATPAGPADPLLAAMVLPLRDGVRAEQTLAGDPVAESFARMLRHEPSRHAPPLPGDAVADPLIAAVVLPLLRSNHYTVASVTLPRGH